MSKYKYTDPITNGYTKFKLTEKQHNNLFKYRQIGTGDKYEYYYNDSQIILHRFTNWKAITLTTILFPILVILHGVINYKEAWKELIGLYNQKKLGSFSGDSVQSGSEKYMEIMSIIKEKSK